MYWTSSCMISFYTSLSLYTPNSEHVKNVVLMRLKRRVPKRLKPNKTWIFIRCRRSDVKFSPFFMMKCIWFDHSLYICFFMYKSSASSMKGNDVYLISIRTNIFLFFLRVKLTILFNQNNSNSKPKVLRSVISLPIFSCSWMPIVRFILNQVTLWMKFKQNCKIKGTSKRNKINSLAYFFGGSLQLYLLNQKLQLFCVELNGSWINWSQCYKTLLRPIMYQKKAIKCKKTKQKYFFYRPFLSNPKTIFLFVIVLALKSLCLLLMARLQTKILLAR